MGRGSIKQITLDSGQIRWHAVYDVPAADGGRRQARRSFRTKREAVDHLNAIMHDPIAVSKEPLGSYLERFLAVRLRAGEVKPITYHRYVTQCRLRLVSVWDVPIGKLTRRSLQAVFSEAVSGVQPITLTIARNVLNRALKEAVLHKELSSNPAEGIRLGKVVPHRPAFWTGAQVAMFLDATKDDEEWGVVWLTLARTLMRVGELIALQWGDVDLVVGTLTVERTRTEDQNGRAIVGPPKSEAGRRVIPLGSTLVVALKAHRVRQNERRLFLDRGESVQPLVNVVAQPLGVIAREFGVDAGDCALDVEEEELASSLHRAVVSVDAAVGVHGSLLLDGRKLIASDEQVVDRLRAERVSHEIEQVEGAVDVGDRNIVASERSGTPSLGSRDRLVFGVEAVHDVGHFALDILEGVNPMPLHLGKLGVLGDVGGDDAGQCVQGTDDGKEVDVVHGSLLCDGADDRQLLGARGAPLGQGVDEGVEVLRDVDAADVPVVRVDGQKQVGAMCEEAKGDVFVRGNGDVHGSLLLNGADDTECVGCERLVFDRGDGQPLAPATVRAALKRAVMQTGLPHLTPHGFRHSGGSYLINVLGIPVKVVSELMGHASTAITLDLYTHADAETSRAAVEALEHAAGG